MFLSIPTNKCPATLPLFLVTAASLFMPVLAQQSPVVTVKYYVATRPNWAGLAVSWNELPPAGLSSLSPYKTDTTLSINYPSTRGAFATSERDKNVAALFEGYLYVDSDINTICVTSDDGSKLYIDDELKVNNDGRHDSVTVCQSIAGGLQYKFALEYFEAIDSAELILKWGSSSSALSVVPSTAWRDPITTSPSAAPSFTPAPTTSPSAAPSFTSFTPPITTSPSAAPSPSPTMAPSANGGGDPHFKTFNGKAFSYHGECDLVLMRSRAFDDGKGLSIHVRTTRMDNYHGAAYSLISAAAVQMGNTVLEVSADEDGGSLLVDGSRRAFTNGDVLSFAAGYTLERSTKGKHGLITVFDLNLGGERRISIRCNTKSMMLFVDVTGYFEDSEGLLGAPVGGSEGLGSRPNAAGHRFDMTGNWNSYGEEWQVLDTEPNLFQEKRFPQYPEGCVYESTTAFKDNKRMLRRRLLLDSVDEAALEIDARKACAKSVGEEDTIMSQFCFNDVMATGDLELAEDPFYHTSSVAKQE